MKFLIISIFLLLSLSKFSHAQTRVETDSTHKASYLKIQKEQSIEKVIKSYQSSFKQEGYRVQIFSGNKKQPAKEMKAKYISLHHKNKAHEIYQQPYFKVRVGDFRTKLEALAFQKELAIHFPNCFIVKDEIEIEELVK
ncbi:MAG: SPOR domain-containing protein [Flavobacteriales bacterium]|nr:SPOR domain-containing protein [Flavobacteriales bacterium]MCB9336086.1 SPOR domain-containing protein [Flavobacteriales bacterium]